MTFITSVLVSIQDTILCSFGPEFLSMYLFLLTVSLQ